MVLKKAWVISVDMGYGHQRAAYPLKDIAYERIITANNDNIVTAEEMITWRRFQSLYEGVSRMRSLPIVGEPLWKMYDQVQSITPFYPFRDLSRPNVGSVYLNNLIKDGFMKSIVEYTTKKKAPFVSTFFAPALAASHAKLKDVYCIVTDTDINRIWVGLEPKKDKLYYLTPTEHSTKRLIEYGVPEENIFFTGFPLPKENLGEHLEILKRDLGERLPNLDPANAYVPRYKEVIKRQLGKYYKTKSNHPLTLTFCIGGAGAQKEIGAELLKSLKDRIKYHRIRVNIIAGTRLEVGQYFTNIIKELHLVKDLGSFVNIYCTLEKKKHFEVFNEVLHTTDILWTKPSELSFYSALGVPVVIAPPLGSHEILNMKWMMHAGCGIQQENSCYVNEWLFEWLEKGLLAKAAWEGYMEAPKYGTYNIENLIFANDKKKVKFRY